MSKPPSPVETNTNGKHRVIIFCLLLKSSCPEGPAFYTQGLFNKQVCLTCSAQPVPGLGLAGCYWLQLAALHDRTSCLLCPRLKASLMAELAGGPGLQNLQPATGQEAAHDSESTQQHQNTHIRSAHQNIDRKSCGQLPADVWRLEMISNTLDSSKLCHVFHWITEINIMFLW